MFVANEAKLLQSLEGKCRNNTAKVIYLKLKLASSFFPISLREISTMTSGLAEKIDRKGSVEISLSFPLSIAIYWLILGLLRERAWGLWHWEKSAAACLGHLCEVLLGIAGVPAALPNSSCSDGGSCDLQQFTLYSGREGDHAGLSIPSAPKRGLKESGTFLCTMLETGSQENVVIVGSGFWSIPFLLSYGLPFPVLHSASPACSFAAGWWQRQVSPCTKQSSATAAEMQCTAGGEKCRAESPWVDVWCPATQPVPATAPRQHLNSWSYWLCKINSYFY